ncbi:MAG: 3'(2'),5'-bisphosphate nucleotidase CysQ [Candidatus Competibacteraceae bacterium]
MSVAIADLLGPVTALATEAGARILEIYGTAFQVDEKEDNSPLTAADLASHKAIVAGLQQLTPEIPILSEESAGIPFAERQCWERFWLVDPLDGTKEFIKRNGEFTVNIALVEGHEPVLGVVQIPVKGLCYFAARGQGAFRQETGRTVERIEVSPLGTGPVRVVGSRSHGGKRLEEFVARLGDHTLVSIGSALKFCLVAEGKADIYPRLGLTSEWDTAAAQCIVEEAGGRVIAVSGERLAYNTKESLLNPYFLVVGDAGREWRSYLPASL